MMNETFQEHLRWVDGCECWWTQLSVAASQRPWVEDCPTLLARGYAFRQYRSHAGFFFAGEKAVAMAVYYDSPEAGAYVIGGFLVDEGFQGRGYGRQAAELLLAEMGRDGRYSRVELCCMPENEGGIRFWERMGFFRADAREDTILMRRLLWDVPDGLCLAEITPANWRAAVEVREDQQQYVTPRDKLLARAYGFLDDRSQARLILCEETPVGMALWYDCPEENAYALIEFFIDGRFQGQGYGRRAVELILEEMRRDGRYDQVVICYIRENTAAGRFWERLGFVLDPGEEEQAEPVMRRSLTVRDTGCTNPSFGEGRA